MIRKCEIDMTRLSHHRSPRRNYEKKKNFVYFVFVLHDFETENFLNQHFHL